MSALSLPTAASPLGEQPSFPSETLEGTASTGAAANSSSEVAISPDLSVQNGEHRSGGKVRWLVQQLGWQGGLFVLFLLLSGASAVGLFIGMHEDRVAYRAPGSPPAEVELVAEALPAALPGPASPPIIVASTPAPAVVAPPAAVTPPPVVAPPPPPPPPVAAPDPAIALAGATRPAADVVAPAIAPPPAPAASTPTGPAATGAVLSGGISDDDTPDIVIRANPAAP